MNIINNRADWAQIKCMYTLCVMADCDYTEREREGGKVGGGKGGREGQRWL